MGEGFWYLDFGIWYYALVVMKSIDKWKYGKRLIN